MAPSRERLIELMLEEAHGNPPPDLSRKIMGALDQPVIQPVAAQPLPAREAPVLRPAFPWHWFAAAAAAAVMVGAGLALMFSGNDTPVDQPAIAGPGSNQAVQPAPQPAPQPRPQPQPAPQPQPEREPAPQPSPQPEPQPAPETPQPQPEPQPEPEPAPKPPEEVERPQPEPQPEPAPKPTPEEPPTKPGPVIDEPPVKPEPAPQPPQPERPPTEAPRTGPVRVAMVAYQSPNAKLSYKEAGATRFTEVKPETELMSGWTLSTRHPVLLDLGQGRRAWFDGELGIDSVEGVVSLEIIKEGVYLDTLGGKGAVILRRGETSIEVTDAAVVVEKMSTSKDGIEVSCLDGELSWGESKLLAGQGAQISGKGFKRGRVEGAKLRDHKLVRELAAAQKLTREEFDGRLGERLYAGEAEGGIVHGSEKEVGIGLTLADQPEVTERTFIRVRMRVSAPTGLYLQLIGDEGKSRFGKDFLVPAGHWVTLRFAVAAQREGGDNGRAQPKGEQNGKEGKEKEAAREGAKALEKAEAKSLLCKFQALCKNKAAKIEIDWIEIGEDPAQK